ncbi:MAG: DUF4396 domain-containing protein [Ignavibacteria bacterium]|nr:DUF4396 domain-containing protein [Ignavibacteria bacterium]
MEHTHNHYNNISSKNDNNFLLALSATLHCLLGCGLGEVAGMIISVPLMLDNNSTMILSIVLGIIGGFGLGVIPLKKAGYKWLTAFKQVLIAEGLSIEVMKTFEVIAQMNIPGVMESGLGNMLFWYGMILSLVAGFIAAFPVNYYFVKIGIRHSH